MPLILNNIELYMGPTELEQPDDIEAAITGFIAGAKQSLDIAVQELDSEPIARTIIEAKKRGVRVTIVMEADYLSVDKPPDDPWQPFPSDSQNEMNRTIYSAILRSQIDVRTDINPAIFHQKFIVRDASKSDAAVLTGSANFTVTDSHKNLNHLIIIHSKKAADIYSVEFNEIATGNMGLYRSRYYPKPGEITVSGVRIKVLFAPDHSPEMEIMKQMLKAKERIDFAIFTFSQSSGIDDTMVALQKAGIKIRGIFDKGQGNQTWASTRVLKSNKIEVYLASKDPKLRKLHHKLMVIDKQLIIAGSFNYTDPANTLNDENIIIFGDLFEEDSDSIKSQKKLGKFAFDNIEKMIADFGDEVL